MKHILLPTDFSDHAWNAIFTALKLYKGVECQFYLLHAYEPKAGDLIGKKGKQRLGVLYDSMSAYSNQELDKIIDYLAKNHNNDKHRFEKISAEDDLVDAIQTILVKVPVDLVVMGTQGNTAKRGVFMGSGAVAVIKKIRSHPILVVPSEYHFQALKSVVFPTDYSRQHQPHELKLLLELLLDWKASLKIIHLALEFDLSPEQQAIKKLLHHRLKDVEHSFHTIERTTSLSKAIEEFSTRQQAEMIALIHYQHTFLEKLTREPVVKKVGFKTRIPLLVLPDH